MTRTKQTLEPIAVVARTHGPAVLTAAHRYATAAAHYEAARAAGTSVYLAHARFLEIAGDLDRLLTTLVLRTETTGRLVSTGTDAARIKAAARDLATDIKEEHVSHRNATAHFTTTVRRILAIREAEDALTNHPAQELQSAALIPYAA